MDSIESSRQLPFRVRHASWVRRRGVEIGEIVNVGASVIYAWRSVEIWNGRTVAPLTAQTLAENGGIWYWCLIANALVVFVAMVVGLIKNNNYFARMWVSLISSVMWILVSIAAWQSSIPYSVASGYLFSCFISFLTAIILSQRAVYARKRSQMEAGS